jgi:methionine sulfoxide reductase heme-binding subunit
MQSANPRSLDEPLGGTRGGWHHRLLHFHIPIAMISVLIIFLWMSFPFRRTIGHQGSPQALQTPNHAGSPKGHNQSNDHQGSQHSNTVTSPADHNGNQPSNLARFQDRLFIARFTSATGYVGLGLLGLTLLIGPANLLLQRRTPISTYLARDVGMWAAIMSVVHVIAGLFVHGPPAPLVQRIPFYFFASNGAPLINNFGWGNWTGLAATVIVVGLLAISNDAALRKLQAKRWKNFQRLNYALFVLVIAHAIFYGALLRVTSITTILLGMIVSMVFIGQMAGIWLWRRRHSRIHKPP